MAKKIRLGKRQREILQHLIEGWTLTSMSGGRIAYYWHLRHENCDSKKNVPAASAEGLVVKGLVKRVVFRTGWSEYKISAAGRAVMNGSYSREASGRVLKKRNERGWASFEVNDHWCAAQILDEPSTLGIDGGRVSRLAISKTGRWQGLNRCVYNFDRGLDFDETLPGLLEQVLAFIEANF